MAQVIYKIRHKVTGLFRAGGSKWTKKGKTWHGMGPLKNHLNLFRMRDGNWSPSIAGDVDNWELIAIEITESSASTPFTNVFGKSSV